jgi:hypothetical protein
LCDEIIVRQALRALRTDTQCIFVRGPLAFTPDMYFNDIGSYDFPALQALPAVMPLVEFTCAQIGADATGRVLIVKFEARRPCPAAHRRGPVRGSLFAVPHCVDEQQRCANTTNGETTPARRSSGGSTTNKCTPQNNGVTDRVHLTSTPCRPLSGAVTVRHREVDLIRSHQIRGFCMDKQFESFLNDLAGQLRKAAESPVWEIPHEPPDQRQHLRLEPALGWCRRLWWSW